MLRYTYITPKKERKFINIEILKYDFTNRWVNYITSLANKCPNINWYIAGLNDVSTGQREVECNVNELLKLRDIFNYINRNGLSDFDQEITEIEHLMAYPFKVKQSHLNKWHRMFTSLEMKYLKLPEESLPTHIDRQELWQNIQDINTYTHHLEMWTYCMVERRQPYNHIRQYSIQFTNANNLNYLNKENQVFSSKNIEFIEEGGFDFFTQEYHCSVWLHEDITGKDQMKAWLDEDNLTEFDITGNLLMTPSITLDPDFLYAKILDNEMFRKDSKESNKTLDRYPIGNIIEPNKTDWAEFKRSTIEQVTLNNNILWPRELL